MAETIPHLLQRAKSRFGTAPAYHVRTESGWQATSWSDYADEVRQAAGALVALGVAPQVPVCVLGANQPAWTIFAAGAMTAGSTPAGIYATSSPEECRYIIDHAEAPVVLVQNRAQWEKIAAVRDQLPGLRHIVTMPGAEAIDDAGVLTWDAFMKMGDNGAASVDERLAGLAPDTPGTFIYTSGTTGRPKAVVLTHANLFWTASAAAGFIGISTGDRTLSYLPLAHIAEQMFTIHGPVVGGGAVYYSRGIDKLRDDLVEVKPTVFFGVPRVWEKFHAGVEAKLAEATGAKAKIAQQAMTAGRERAAHLNRGEKLPLTLELSTKAFDKVVYHKVKAALGLDQARFCASGAAPVAKEILEFFAGLGIIIHEVYGQSEDTGPTSFNAPGRTKFGTVGPPLPGVNVKIAEDGEILVQGPNVFAGYYKDPEATAATLQDGWLHSGDLGEFDSDGFLSITGRKKDIIITAGGKNVAPKLLEAGIKQHPAVSEAVLIGDERPYIVALVALDTEAATGLMAQKGWSGPPHTSAELRADIEAHIEAVNREFGKVAQVKSFAVLPRDLSMAEGELTPTLKVKRSVVAAHFDEVVHEIYSR